MDYINWNSRNGTAFRFGVCSPRFDWPEQPGLYMFCRRTAANLWQPVYVGQAGNFRTRPLSNHEQWRAAAAVGATAVLAMVVPSQDERDRLEEILIRELHPELNVQLRAAPSLGAYRRI